MLALLVLLAVCAFSSSPSISASIASAPELDTAEPFWGRIYLRHGAVPIQYFRDSFGGAMLAREAEFRFPFDQVDNRSGCRALGSDEHFNGSAVLVVTRGECSFEQKARVAEAAGAGALVVVNDDESVTRPMAHIDDGEIQIPSVMVRRTAGELLRATVLGATERVFGRLVPMQCSRGPSSVCFPRTASERAYIVNALARSGVVMSTADGSVVGEFLASKFGGVMPQRAALPVSALLRAAAVCQSPGADADAMPRVDGKVALIAGGEGTPPGCSVADMVARAQSAGALAVLVATDSVSTRPSVAEDWHGYNVTIFSGVVTAATMQRIVALQEQSPALGLVHFALQNAIADAWEAIRELARKSAWPVRVDRKEKLVRRLLGAFALSAGQKEALKSHFLAVAGGSEPKWERLVRDAEGVVGRQGEEEATLSATAAGPLATAAGGSHEEL
ncbi:hypothetical protein PybrP1_011862 [[Pythium] brassicae (nom. inval.)]|nr:hypothetical protein PybrP1_011862 [[Pythium] brassicae (nom. inval.)]